MPVLLSSWEAEARDGCLSWEFQASLGNGRQRWVEKQSLDYTQGKKKENRAREETRAGNKGLNLLIHQTSASLFISIY